MALCCVAIKIQTDGNSTAFTTDEFMPYIELHASSAFSFLRAGSFPEQLAETAAELEMPALALLDRDGVYGAQRFSVAAREHNVRPIIGCELTMEDGAILAVLVENRTGYKNLCELLPQAHLRSEKGKCAVQWSELPALTEGLVALVGEPVCSPIERRDASSVPYRSRNRTRNPSPVRQSDGLVPWRTRTRPARSDILSELDCFKQSRFQDGHAPENCPNRAQFLIDAFGRENVFVEIQRHFIRGEERVNRQLVDLARANRLSILATNGVQYAKSYGRDVLDVFTCIREHTHLDIAGKLLAQNAERHLKGDRAMREIFRDFPEAIEN